MAHHRPDLLRALLEALDDPRNDVYLHIDKKSLGVMPPAMFSMKRGHLLTIPSMRVSWGSPSQVICALRMLEAAVQDGHHLYYHLLTGASYPLKSQDEIHSFFADQAGTEFIGFAAQPCAERIRFFWLFKDALRDARSGKYKAEMALHRLQELAGIDRLRKYRMTCRKGLAYWSVTEDLARCVLEKKDLIRKMTRHSACSDEIFMQTIAWNSPFREKLYHRDALTESASLRLTTWEIEETEIRPGHNFKMKDLPVLLSSDAMFALKFEGPAGMHLISILKDRISPLPSRRTCSSLPQTFPGSSPCR